MVAVTARRASLYLDGGLSGEVRRSGQRAAAATAGFAAGGPDHGKMLGRRDDLPFGHLHVLLASRDDEHRLLPPDGGLYVGVGLGPQGFDLTT